MIGRDFKDVAQEENLSETDKTLNVKQIGGKGATKMSLGQQSKSRKKREAWIRKETLSFK